MRSDPVTSFKRLRALALGAALALFLLGGCASTADPRDPFEPVNRAIYKFNDGFDALLARPAAEFYRAVVPQVFRTGVSNFFSNIGDVINALNNLLQGKVPEAIVDVGRIMVNTTLGVFGVRDVATELDIPKSNEDFGQTLGRWGFGDGPYIVLPLLGPSSVRDTFGWVGDLYTTPLTYIDPNHVRNSVIAFRFVTIRADLLEASDILATASLDPYEFIRDAYLQRRRNLVYDGKPPEDKEFDITPEPKAKPDGKPEPKPAAKADIKPDAKLEGKPDAKPEGKPDAKPEAKPEPKPLTGTPAAPDQAASAGSSSAEPALVLKVDRSPVEEPKKPPLVRIWLP